MAQAMCPGDCGTTGSLKAVTSHMASCAAYGKRFASGVEMPDPVDMWRSHTADRPASAPPRVARAPRPEVSVPAATVSAPVEPIRPPRRSAPVTVPARNPEPVYVERWEVPTMHS